MAIQKLHETATHNDSIIYRSINLNLAIDIVVDAVVVVIVFLFCLVMQDETP
jgi:hypothetical protein